MKRVILFLLLTLITVYANASKYDILINAANFNFSPDLRQITLDSPIFSLKNETSNTHLQSLSVNDFMKLWKPSPTDKKGFAALNPNAILTCWDKEKNYLESSFIIKKPYIKGSNFVLDVEYLEKGKDLKIAGALPIIVNSKPATKSDLDKFLANSAEGASVVIIVDNPSNPFDPHGGKH
ncbi:MAG TPA: hypothetical protein VMW10_00635 [Alphaproteobacteria bacterium]|nr:hypothetical protein [Alphaproteobacteria bacterium]